MLPQFVNNKKRKGTSNVILQRLNMIAPPNLALLEKELLCKWILRKHFKHPKLFIKIYFDNYEVGIFISSPANSPTLFCESELS